MGVTVTPTEQRVGRLRVDVALGGIARMFPADDWRQTENTGGGAVFAGRANEVVENVARESDAERAPTGLFNLDAHVRDLDSGHPVPYLDVRVDVSRDGVDVLKDVPLVPVARPHKGTAGLHYGNNVALEPEGLYDIVVRLAPGPLTGTDTDELAQFTVDFDHHRTGAG